MDIQNKRTGTGGVVPPIDSSLEGAPNNVVPTPPPSTTQDKVENVDDTQPIVPSDSSTRATSTTASHISTQIPDQFKGSGYDDLIPYMERKVREFKPLTEEELKKIRRRQKAEGIISGISDAVRSVANLIATHNYAPNMFNAKEGMSEKAKARFEKEEADRKAKEDEWYNYALTLGKLKDAKMQKGLEAWKTEQTLARQDRKYEEEAKRKNDIAEAQRGKMEAAKAKDEAMTAYYETKTKYLVDGWPLEVAEREAKIAQIKAETDRANRQETGAWVGGRGGSGGKAGEYPWYDKDGNLHYAHSYEAARQNGLQNGTWQDGTQTTNQIKKDDMGFTTTTDTTKPAKGYSVRPKSKGQTSKPQKKKNRLGL